MHFLDVERVLHNFERTVVDGTAERDQSAMGDARVRDGYAGVRDNDSARLVTKLGRPDELLRAVLGLEPLAMLDIVHRVSKAAGEGEPK